MPAKKKKKTKATAKKAKKKAKTSAKKVAKKPAKKAAKKKAKAAPKKAKAKARVAAKGAAVSDEGFAIALPGRKSSVDVAGAYKGANLDHHPVTRREIEEVAHEGLRGDGEILHVEENEFAPCRLVDHGEERFSLCFDDFRMPKVPLFEERGLQGGGYTWEALVSSLVHMKRPDLEPDLTYDSEAGMFVALGSRESLRSVAKLIQQAIKDPAFLKAGIDAADPDRLE